jgi:1-acyl-sn-glycerol-3-phosphate acyltransferase
MIVYSLLRSLAGIALRWFYRRIDVEGLDRLPTGAPTLLVVNHPNALVDAMLVGWAIPRRVTLTAKATLFQNRLLARFLGWVGVVPLVRASDVREAGGAGAPVDPNRNARAFGALRDVLGRGGAVVIFPEGISHDQPSLAPLRTGAARIALDARDEARVRDLQIVPIGLMFERKDAPRTRVVVQIGHPISLDEWQADGDSAVIALTHEIETRLRAVTLNYHSSDEASRAAALSSVFASLLRDELPSVGDARPFAIEVSLARRISDARQALVRTTDEQLRARADRLLQTLAAFEVRLARHRVSADDIRISTDGRNAAPFLLREGWMIALAGPIAMWGWLNHWIPFHAARALAMRRVESASDPAMRTILAGATLVLAFYAAQSAVVAWLGGWLAALLYVVSLPIAADANFLLRARLRRALRRARTYLLFRRRPKLHASLEHELQTLRAEALEIERQLQITTTSEASA